MTKNKVKNITVESAPQVTTVWLYVQENQGKIEHFIRKCIKESVLKKRNINILDIKGQQLLKGIDWFSSGWDIVEEMISEFSDEAVKQNSQKFNIQTSTVFLHLHYP